jgi:ATP-dependent Lon protease
MVTALVSLLTNRTACSDTAMTGEISLRGLRAAGGRHQREGRRPRRRLLPARNRKDYEESRRPRATLCAFCGPSGSKT